MCDIFGKRAVLDKYVFCEKKNNNKWGKLRVGDPELRLRTKTARTTENRSPKPWEVSRNSQKSVV